MSSLRWARIAVAVSLLAGCTSEQSKADSMQNRNQQFSMACARAFVSAYQHEVLLPRPAFPSSQPDGKPYWETLASCENPLDRGGMSQYCKVACVDTDPERIVLFISATAYIRDGVVIYFVKPGTYEVLERRP